MTDTLDLFRLGDKVLVFLLADTNKFLMQWKGPFEVVGQVAQNDYGIKLGRTSLKVFHANMLKVYVNREVFQEAETTAIMAVIEPPDEVDCLNLPGPGIG